MNQYSIFSNSQYYKELVSRLTKTKAGDRVRLATMSFMPDDKSVRAIVDALGAAAQRGVDVMLMIDAHSFLIDKAKLPGPLLYERTFARHALKRFRIRAEALGRLKASGGHYIVTNMPDRLLTNPYKGRSHMKFAIINDYVMVGGCNLEQNIRIDFMVGWQDKMIADQLDRLMSSIADNKGSVPEAMQGKDVSMPIDQATMLFIDSGIKDQSLIFDEALAAIDNAKKRILMTCQFFPNDATIHHLAAAKARGVDVKIIYNHPGKHDFPLNLGHHYVLRKEKKHRPASFFVNELPKSCEYIHAKFLMTEKICIVGSHNLVNVGVTYGTAEVALKSMDKKFAKQLLASLIGQLKDDHVTLQGL